MMMPHKLQIKALWEDLPDVVRRWALRSDRKPYLIKAPPWGNGSAGTRVLHLLCHRLNQAGEHAYIIIDHPRHLNKNLFTPFVREPWARMMALCGAIVVYPEREHGNAFHAKTVVRYVLNRPGLLGGDSIYDERELVFVYSAVLSKFVQNSLKGLLFLPSIEPEIFHARQQEERDLITFYVGKGQYREGVVDRGSSGVVEITKVPQCPETREELAELFRRSRVFYCFDMLSITASEARLCGCPVVLFPDQHYSKEQIAEQELGFEGITFENSDSAIEEARRYVHVVQERYAAVTARFKEQLADFIEMTQGA